MIDPSLIERAQSYANKNEIALMKTLGFGDDGAVWSTNRRTAIKAFRRETNYLHELECTKGSLKP